MRGLAVSPDVTMRLYVPRGRLRISTWTRDSVDIRGTISKSSRLFGGGSRTHVKFGIEASVVDDRALPYADWNVTVPRDARLWVKMIDGDITATGTAGELELYAVSGSIVVRAVSGVTMIESIDASVSVAEARGDLRVRGSRGKVLLESVHGTASVATVSGPVTLAFVTADGRVETIGGDITMKGAPQKGATMELQSHSGAMWLSFDATRTPLLDLSSRAGPVLGDSAMKGAAQFGQVVARSFKGRITVRRFVVTP